MPPPHHTAQVYSEHPYKQEGQSKGNGAMACTPVADGWLETEVALFLAEQAAARTAPPPQYGTSPLLALATPNTSRRPRL